MEREDVLVRYYNGSRHNTATITFRNGIEELISAERVVLDKKDERIYFVPAENKGLKLTNKIQLWSDCDLIQDWDGKYPLRYDETKELYYIDKKDRTPMDNNRLGCLSGVLKPNYTPHYGIKAGTTYRAKVKDNITLPKNDEPPKQAKPSNTNDDIKNLLISAKTCINIGEVNIALRLLDAALNIVNKEEQMKGGAE